jgi:hypothetical protein
MMRLPAELFLSKPNVPKLPLSIMYTCALFDTSSLELQDQSQFAHLLEVQIVSNPFPFKLVAILDNSFKEGSTQSE